MVHRFAIAHSRRFGNSNGIGFDVLLRIPKNRKVWQEPVLVIESGSRAYRFGRHQLGCHRVGGVVRTRCGIIALSDGKPDRPVPTYNQKFRVAPFPGVPPKCKLGHLESPSRKRSCRREIASSNNACQEIFGEQTERTEIESAGIAQVSSKRVNVLPNDPFDGDAPTAAGDHGPSSNDATADGQPGFPRPR